jgi:hypothetical protein
MTSATKKTNLKLNLLNYVPIRESVWSDDEIAIIKTKCNLSDDDLWLVLRWNVLTISQVAMLANVSQSTVRNAITPIVRKNGEITARLSVVNAFPDSGNGKMFILVDDFCRRFILK